MITPSTNSVVTARFAGAMYNLALDYSTTQQVLASTSTPGAMTDLENQLFIRDFSNMATGDVATIVATNLGLTGEAFDAAVVFLTGWITGTVFAERGAVIAQIVNNFSLMTEDPTFGTFAKAWNVKVGNAVAYAQNSSSTATIDFDDVPSANLDSFTLTNGTDIATANIFTAGLVYTPGGNDRINSLQDEDQLTGTGNNPTLNATLGNANDNGATIITPKFTGISIINTAFTGSGAAVTALDLQDATGQTAVNITRVSQAIDYAEVGNIMTPASSLSLANTNANQAGVVEFSYGANVLRGDNTGSIAVSNVQVGRLNIGQNTSGITAPGVTTNGFEHLTLNSTGAANTIGTLDIPMDTGTSGNLTITGDQALTLAARANILQTAGSVLVEGAVYTGGVTGNQGRLASIDASALTAPLALNIAPGLLTTGKADTSGVVQNVSIKGTGVDDIFFLNDTVQNGDNIDGGAGNDTLLVYTGGVGTVTLSGGVYSTTSGPTLVSGVERVDVQATGNVNIDFARIPDASLVNLRNIDNTLGVSADNGDWTVVLANLTAAQGAALNIQHSTTTNNSIVDTTVVGLLKDSSGGNDLVGISINEGVNADPRFNFTLQTNTDNPATVAVERVENLTITETDTESNSVELGSAAGYVGTITLTGGLANPVAGGGLPTSTTPSTNRFLNLDVDTASLEGGLNGLKLINVSGGAVDGVGWQDVGALATEVRLVAGVIDAAAENSDVILRVSTTAANTNGGQKITMGAGNDTVIFDDIGVASATRGNAGLTNADTVAGGAGNNVLVIDGDGTRIVLQQSEWDNVSGFQSLYLAGNGGGLAAPQYFLQIDNDLITKNGTDGNLITIGNDDGSVVSTVDNVDSRLSNNGVRIDATTLSADKHFAYDGEEGTGSTLDRFVVNDQNTNGGNIIDGGDVNIQVGVDSAGVTRQLAGVQSGDVLEVRNTATVTTADLTQVKNVGTIVINNDQAVAQTLNLSLNSTVVDALSDSGHTATLAEKETLTIIANDGQMTDAAGSAIAPSAASALNINAREVSGAFNLNITGDQVFAGNDALNLAVNLGGGKNTINLGAGTDAINFYTVAGVQVQTTATGLKFVSASGLSTQDVDLDAGNTIKYFDQTTGAELSLVGGVLVPGGGGGVTYTLTSSAPTVNEGSSVTFNLATTGVAAGTVLNYVLSGAGITTADTTVPLNGTLTVGATGAASLVVSPTADTTTEGAETLTMTITGTTATSSVTIIDTSTAAPVGNLVVLPVGTTAEVVATAAAETFTFDVAGARASAPNTQIPLTGFAVANDSLQIDLVTANPAITNLSQLNGVDGIAVEANVILNNTLINFGNDANGDVISVTLAGILDPATVSVSVI
ncbi:beta strand repeat-containing protein [Candidatus Accumulibacter phosphatis]|uniref:Putative autotransporter protein n=1 Tax=Candidatus Accumulibacter phosphatis TaxID=327160 RepID=A0A5S4F5J8_9PROT|nr:hypothetical protein [Candidatus Accumulibacter phosphatis]TMQ76023.1 putative autotransporter protein [Candidatus Accumulibacter phosphatis]